jgi:hypothetical protein
MVFVTGFSPPPNTGINCNSTFITPFASLVNKHFSFFLHYSEMLLFSLQFSVFLNINFTLEVL